MLNSINIIKCVAIIWVTNQHVMQRVVDDSSYTFFLHPIGVELFFAVSGYLTLRWFDAKHSANFVETGCAFFLTRVTRIYPLTFISLILCLFILEENSFDPISVFFLSLSLDPFEKYGNPVLWSLNVEIYFYLFCLVFFSIAKSKKIYLLSLLVISVIGQSLSILIFEYFIYFLVGGILFYSSAKILPFFSIKSFPLFVITIFVVIITIYLININLLITNLILVTYIFLFIQENHTFFKRLKLIEWLGKYCFTIYLFHIPILWIIEPIYYLGWLTIFFLVILFCALITPLEFYLEKMRFNLKSKYVSAQLK